MDISLGLLLATIAPTLILITASLNVLWLRPPRSSKDTKTILPTLDVLIPARNEANTIGRCVKSILAQNYPNLTVTILDDNSTDTTKTILEDIASTDNRVRIMYGEPLPKGWTGKNWACHQLSLMAKADLLLFTDADTWFNPQGIKRWVEAHLLAKADLTTLVPGRQAASVLELLVIGFINWFILALLPLPIAYRTRMPMLSMTFGQFMLFSATAYNQIGGYQSIRASLTDDVSLGRQVKSHGLRWRLFDGSRDVVCNMYATRHELIYGVGRSILPVFGHKITYLFAANIAFLGLSWLPLIALIYDIAANPSENSHPELSALMVLSMVITWYLSQRKFDQPIWIALLYPIGISLVIFISIHSVITMHQGRSTWKGRILSKPK